VRTASFNNYLQFILKYAVFPESSDKGLPSSSKQLITSNTKNPTPQNLPHKNKKTPKNNPPHNTTNPPPQMLTEGQKLAAQGPAVYRQVTPAPSVSPTTQPPRPPHPPSFPPTPQTAMPVQFFLCPCLAFGLLFRGTSEDFRIVRCQISQIQFGSSPARISPDGFSGLPLFAGSHFHVNFKTPVQKPA